MPVSRLPVFILGMAFGLWQGKERGALRTAGYALSFAVGLALVEYLLHRKPWLLIEYGLYWYPFLLIAPPLCIGLAFILQKADTIKRAFAPLRWVGQSSFEIYLINVWIYELSKQYTVPAWAWALLCAGNLLLGIGYHALVARITRRFSLAASEG